MTAAVQHRAPPFRAALFLAACGALLAVLLVWLWQSIAEGGNPWQQGDWLINYGAGFVRRGLGGEIVLGLSRWTGADPLVLLGALQAAALVALVLGTARAAIAAGLPDRLLVLLVSPAFLPFWAYDYLGAMRKDAVALLAFLPLLAPAASPGAARLRAGVALALFALAVALHEANGFLAPFLSAALWLARPPGGGGRVLWLAPIAIAGLGMAAALVFSSVPDTEAVCAALLAQGLREGLCSGAIEWLGFDLARSVGEGRTRIEVSGFPASIVVSYALALLPVAAALWRAPRRGRLVAAAIGAGFLFAPLYVVALDWGRWIFLHIAGLTFLILVAARHRPLPWLHRPLSPAVLAFLLSASALWSMNFFTGELGPGLLQRVLGLGLPGAALTGTD